MLTLSQLSTVTYISKEFTCFTKMLLLQEMRCVGVKDSSDGNVLTKVTNHVRNDLFAEYLLYKCDE